MCKHFSLRSGHINIDLVDLSSELVASSLKGRGKSHLDIKKISLQDLNQFEKLCLLIVVATGSSLFFHVGAHLVDLAEDVLLSLLVGFDLGDRFDFGATLGLGHLGSAEGNFGFLLLLLTLD